MAAFVRSIRPSIEYPTARQLAAARKRGKEAMEEPHAVSATYDAERDALSLRFTPDALLVIEHVRKALPELSELTDAELAEVEVVGSGETLLWSENDVAIGVAALAARFVSTRGVRRAALREIAATPSARKAEAARENGMLGGRPPTYGKTRKTTGAQTPARKAAAKKNAKQYPAARRPGS